MRYAYLIYVNAKYLARHQDGGTMEKLVKKAKKADLPDVLWGIVFHRGDCTAASYEGFCGANPALAKELPLICSVIGRVQELLGFRRSQCISVIMTNTWRSRG